MHAPQSPFLSVVGDVALNQPRIQTVLLELPHAETSGEKTPLVFELLRFDDVGAFEYGFFEKHIDSK